MCETRAEEYARQSLAQQYQAEDAEKIRRVQERPGDLAALKIIEGDTLRPLEDRRDYGERLAAEQNRYVRELRGAQPYPRQIHQFPRVEPPVAWKACRPSIPGWDQPRFEP